MDTIWKDREKVVKAVYDIPKSYKLYCVGNAVDVIKDGVSTIEDLRELDRLELANQFAEMCAPPGCQVYLFADKKGHHIITTPHKNLFNGM